MTGTTHESFSRDAKARPRSLRAFGITMAVAIAFIALLNAWLDCGSFGGQEGLDLVRRFDDIVAACGRREAGNLVDFFNKGFLLSAHEPHVLDGATQALKIAE